MAEFELTNKQFKVLEVLLDTANRNLTNGKIAEQAGITERYVRTLRNSWKYRYFQHVLLEERRRLWKEAFVEAMPDIVKARMKTA